MTKQLICSRFSIKLQEGFFEVNLETSFDWTHISMSYIGPEDGQGIRIYSDWQKVAEDDKEKTSSGMVVPGDGMVVAGRRLKDDDYLYASFSLDELLKTWRQSAGSDEIDMDKWRIINNFKDGNIDSKE